VYNNISSTLGNRAIGLAIELYNSKNDPDLNTILAQSNEILVRDSVYRFDFPSINTYTLPFGIQGILPDSGAYVNLVTLEVVTPFSFSFNVIGNIDVNGSLILPRIGDVETTIQGKQNELTAGANITIEGDEVSCDLTAGTNIDITNGVISTTGLATTTQLGTKQDEITINTDLTLNSIDVGDKYSYTSNLISKPIGLYGDTLHYHQVEDDLNTFINSVNEGDTILFPSGSITGNVVMNAVRSVKFIGLIEATTFLGTLDITAETDLDVNYLCRFENIIFTGLVSIAGTRRGHIFKNCSFNGGLSIAGGATSNLNLQFIDCIIKTLNIADTFSAQNFSPALFGYALFMRCDFKDDPINSFTTHPYYVILQDCLRIPDDHTSGNIFNYKLLGSATYEPDVFYIDYLDHIINKAHQYYVFDDDRFKIPTLDTQ
jgi:hypothetical protein